MSWSLQTLRVRRLYDDKNNTLLYVAYSTRLDGSQNVSVLHLCAAKLSCTHPECICCITDAAKSSCTCGLPNRLAVTQLVLLFQATGAQTAASILQLGQPMKQSSQHSVIVIVQTSGSRYKTSICALPVAPSVSPAASAPSAAYPDAMK